MRKPQKDTAMQIYIDTCVLPRSHMECAGYYRDCFGPEIGFELLPMFDLPDFEANLRQNLSLFEKGPLIFHEPVWGVEHSTRKGSPAYEASMYHVRLTQKYAEILQPTDMVYHLNNCRVLPSQKDRMLSVTLENLEEMRDLFPDVRLLVENTGTKAEGNLLLDQAEFTDLCREKGFGLVIDVGHAHANGWDLFPLIRELKSQIRVFHLHNNFGHLDEHNRIGLGTIDFDALIPFIRDTVPDAKLVIEYLKPVYHGQPLKDDIRSLMRAISL